MEISESTNHPTDREKMNSNQEEEEEAVIDILSNAPGKEDIILTIFSYLPIKSILRFKCVSKKNLSLTTNPLFLSLHCAALRSITPFTGFFCSRANSEEEYSWHAPPSFKDNGIFDYVPLPIDINSVEISDPAIRLLKNAKTELPDPSLRFLKHDKTDKIYIHDSCNGLLLCSRRDNFSTKIVCNPLTKQKVVIPFSHQIFPHCIYRLIVELTPMGYFSFNVVCVYQSKKALFSKLRIFSSETGTWENIEDKLPVLSDYRKNIAKVYSNMTLFWDLYDDCILVFYFDKAKRKSDRLCELIKTPQASLGRSLWDHNGKILCYFHGCNEYNFHVRQLCFNETNKLGWKVEDSEEFKSLEEDICMGYWEYIGKERSLCTLPPKSVPFKIMGYKPISKTLVLCIPNAIFFFDTKQRSLEYFWGNLTSKFELFNYIDGYVHCFAPIQVCPLTKHDDSLLNMLKEDTVLEHHGKTNYVRKMPKSFRKANGLEALDPEPKATISNQPISDLNNVDDNPGFMEVTDSTPWHNSPLKEAKETSNRFAKLINGEEGESEVDDSDAVKCVSETPLSSEQLGKEELFVPTVTSPQNFHKVERNAVDDSTNLVGQDCSEFQTLAKQTNTVAEAKATPASTIPKNKGKERKNQRRRNKEVDDKEYGLVFQRRQEHA